MNKMKMAYFEEEDILHLAISDEPEGGSIELSPNITVELNDNGELISIEILNASTFIRDSIMESVQAKLIFIKSLQMSINISILRIEFMKMHNDCKQHLSLTRHLKLNLMEGATR